MASQRYSEIRTLHEENRHGNGGYDISYKPRLSVPIRHSTNDFNYSANEQGAQERIRHQETAVQWVSDPVSGRERFRVNVNIDGFHQNEINARVDGNKLLVYGEHVENTNQVIFPTSVTMQIDFPSRYANVITDDGRTSSNFTSTRDISYRAPPRINQQSSTEYTSTRKVGDRRNYGQSTNPRTYTSYRELYDDGNDARINTYSSASHRQTRDHANPLRSGFTNSATRSFDYSNNPAYSYRMAADNFRPKATYPSTSISESGHSSEKTYAETHRETHHRRSSPTTSVQSSDEVEHRRSGSPSIARNLDEDRFRSSVTIDSRSMTPPSLSRNVEVREYSRRAGDNASNNLNDNRSSFTQGFNSDAFYRSAFQPQVFTDDLGESRIEMKLDVKNYEPHEIKVSVNGNDLIVQAEHNVDRPPTSSSRAYFYKQVTLPPNTDLSSLSSQYHPDGSLHITAKSSQSQSSLRYN